MKFVELQKLARQLGVANYQFMTTTELRDALFTWDHLKHEEELIEERAEKRRMNLAHPPKGWENRDWSKFKRNFTK